MKNSGSAPIIFSGIGRAATMKNQCQENVAPLARDVVEQMVLRQDVEEGGAEHLVGMVEAHAVQHARAAVVAGGDRSSSKPSAAITSTWSCAMARNE